MLKEKANLDISHVSINVKNKPDFCSPILESAQTTPRVYLFPNKVGLQQEFNKTHRLSGSTIDYPIFKTSTNLPHINTR